MLSEKGAARGLNSNGDRYARASLAHHKPDHRQQNIRGTIPLEILFDGVHVNAKAMELK